MHILNEKLYGDFTKLPENVRSMLTKGKTLSNLAKEGIEQDSRISSKTFPGGTSPSKAIKAAAAELGIENPKLVIFTFGEKTEGYLRDENGTLMTKAGLIKSKLISSYGHYGNSSKFDVDNLIRELAKVDEFTVYVVEHSENGTNNKRKENNDFTDKYGQAKDRYGRDSGKTNFMKDATNKYSDLRVQHQQTKLASGKEYSITLNDVKSLKELFELVSKKDAKSIQVDGIYVNPFTFRGSVDFSQNVEINHSTAAFRDIIRNGLAKIGRVRGFKEKVDAMADPEIQYSETSYDIMAIVVGGDIKFQLKAS